MKYAFYISFLVVTAVSYTRLSENLVEDHRQGKGVFSRAPASLGGATDCEAEAYEKFNPHYLNKSCPEIP
jgi:hypothetical protein